jgi:hypothetical protein
VGCIYGPVAGKKLMKTFTEEQEAHFRKTAIGNNNYFHHNVYLITQEKINLPNICKQKNHSNLARH